MELSQLYTALHLGAVKLVLTSSSKHLLGLQQMSPMPVTESTEEVTRQVD